MATKGVFFWDYSRILMMAIGVSCILNEYFAFWSVLVFYVFFVSEILAKEHHYQVFDISI